jgi:hypothetical protein
MHRAVAAPLFTWPPPPPLLRAALTASLHSCRLHWRCAHLVFVLQALLDLTCASNIYGMDVFSKVFGRKLNDGIIGARLVPLFSFHWYS